MSTCKMSPTVEVLLYVAVLLAPGLLSQSPAQPGVLQIDSSPDGASITVDGKLINQKTPASLVVAPGNYKVSVSGSGKPANPNCPVTSFSVTSGQTAEHYCSGTTWTVKPN